MCACARSCPRRALTRSAPAWLAHALSACAIVCRVLLARASSFRLSARRPLVASPRSRSADAVRSSRRCQVRPGELVQAQAPEAAEEQAGPGGSSPWRPRSKNRSAQLGQSPALGIYCKFPSTEGRELWGCSSSERPRRLSGLRWWGGWPTVLTPGRSARGKGPGALPARPGRVGFQEHRAADCREVVDGAGTRLM